GIQLGSDDGVSPNDVSDLDGGPNSLQNFPVVSAAIPSGTDTTIYATLNSSPHTSFGIRFYSSGACDASGFGEGESYLGSTTVSTAGNGDASLFFVATPSLPAGSVVTATASDPQGNTSEFSACRTVTTDASSLDRDADGCADSREAGADRKLGGRRDPLSPWD